MFLNILRTSASTVFKMFLNIIVSDWVCTAVMSNDVMKDLREDLS